MCMVRNKKWAQTILFVIMFAPLGVLAATGGDTTMFITPQQKAVLDLFKWVIGFMLAGQFFWVRKYMIDNEAKHKAHDSDIGEITRNLATVSAILHELHGEHKVMSKRASHRGE